MIMGWTFTISEGEKLPPFYGVAYQDFASPKAHVALFPFNHVIGKAVNLWYALRDNKFNTRKEAYLLIEKVRREAYQDGYAKGRASIENECKREMEEIIASVLAPRKN